MKKIIVKKALTTVIIVIFSVMLMEFGSGCSSSCQPESVVIESATLYQDRTTGNFRLVADIKFTKEGHLDAGSLVVDEAANSATITTSTGSYTSHSYEIFRDQSLPSWSGDFTLTIINHCTGEAGEPFPIKGAEPE